jgi:hypothetical protein
MAIEPISILFLDYADHPERSYRVHERIYRMVRTGAAHRSVTNGPPDLRRISDQWSI